MDFPVDMRLSVSEICSMLRAYQAERGISFDRGELAEYWTKEGVRTAVREILKGTNTLFDDVVKNIENNAGFRRESCWRAGRFPASCPIRKSISA